MNKTQLQTIQYLVDYVEQAVEYPVITLETMARKIDAKVVCCNGDIYQIKKKGKVLFYGDFRMVLEDLTLSILDKKS